MIVKINQCKIEQKAFVSVVEISFNILFIENTLNIAV